MLGNLGFLLRRLRDPNAYPFPPLGPPPFSGFYIEPGDVPTPFSPPDDTPTAPLSPPRPALPPALPTSLTPSAVGRSPELAAYIAKRQDVLSPADIRALQTAQFMGAPDGPGLDEAFFDGILALARKHLRTGG